MYLKEDPKQHTTSPSNLGDVIFRNQSDWEECQNIAAEGVFSAIGEGLGNIINGAVSSFNLSLVNDSENLNQIKKLTNRLKGKTQLRSQAPLIAINHYSKWLKYHGEVINDGSRIVLELERVLGLSRLFLHAYIPALTHLFDYVANVFLEKAIKEKDEAIRQYAPTVAKFYPKEFDEVLTKRKGGVQTLVGNGAEIVKVSNIYLGNWYVAAHSFDFQGSTHLLPTVINVSETPINGVEPRMSIHPYTPHQVHQILDLINQIMLIVKGISNWNLYKSSAERIDAHFAHYERQNHDYHTYSEQEKEHTRHVVEIGQSAFKELHNLTTFCEMANRLCFVILTVCGDSIHRMD